MNKNFDERVAKIALKLPDSPNDHELSFRQKIYPCPIIEIPQEYLLYRLDNTRTKKDQREFIAKNSDAFNDDFFSNDRLEDREQQEKQHELLLKYVDKELKDAWTHSGGQTIPILITKAGLVINGNRRLSYMRSINTESIRCAVVVDASIEDKIKEIEASEDIVPDAKRAYDWISKGLDLIDLKNTGRSLEDIAVFKGMDIGEVKQEIGRVELVIDYLKLIGKPDNFSYAQKDKQIFDDRYKKQLNEINSRAADLGTFLIAYASDDATGARKYEAVKDIIKYPDVANNFFSETLAPSSIEVNEDPLGETLPVAFDEEKLKNIFEDAQATDDLAENLLERISIKKASVAGQGQMKELKKKLKSAATAIASARILIDNPASDKDGIKPQLDAISEDCEYIKGKI